MRTPVLAVVLAGCVGGSDGPCPDGAVLEGDRIDGQVCVDPEGRKVGPHLRDRADGTPHERGQYGASGHRDGTWTRFHENGQRAREETWRDGFMHGPWAEWDAEGRKMLSGAYDQGRKHGKWWDWGPDGRPTELSTWKEGQLSGPAVAWFDGGDLKEVGHHEAGVPVGLWVVFHESGGVASTTPWREGAKEGTERVMTAGGRILRETRFVGGRLESEQTWHLSGAVERRRDASGNDEIVDRDGRRLKWCRAEGPGVLCEEWYPDGTPRARYRLVELRKDGAYATWHPDGTPASAGRYAEGRRVGPWEFRDPSGALLPARSGFFENGARTRGLTND